MFYPHVLFVFCNYFYIIIIHKLKSNGPHYRNSHCMGLGTNIVMSGKKNIDDGRFNYKHCFRIIDVIKNY